MKFKEFSKKKKITTILTGSVLVLGIVLSLIEGSGEYSSLLVELIALISSVLVAEGDGAVTEALTIINPNSVVLSYTLFTLNSHELIRMFGREPAKKILRYDKKGVLTGVGPHAFDVSCGAIFREKLGNLICCARLVIPPGGIDQDGALTMESYVMCNGVKQGLTSSALTFDNGGSIDSSKETIITINFLSHLGAFCTDDDNYRLFPSVPIGGVLVAQDGDFVGSPDFADLISLDFATLDDLLKGNDFSHEIGVSGDISGSSVEIPIEKVLVVT